jgi:hypothetical protein
MKTLYTTKERYNSHPYLLEHQFKDTKTLYPSLQEAIDASDEAEGYRIWRATGSGLNRGSEWEGQYELIASNEGNWELFRSRLPVRASKHKNP